METATFDSAETIAGFPLLSIKHALAWVGMMDDRDDVELVASALECPRPQAERVLTALERRGLVTPTALKNQWKATPLGWQLAWRWKPPPRIELAVGLEDDDDSKRPNNEIFDDVPCSILRTTPDEDDAFEEGKLDVGVIVDYASPRVIEISVSIPDDYDQPDSGAMIESSVYLGVEDAKRFMKALQTSIERGEVELARRAASNRTAKTNAAGSDSSAGQRSATTARVVKKPALATPKSTAAIARAAAAADSAKRREERALEKERAAEQRAAEKKRRSEKRALEETLQELGTKGRRAAGSLAEG